MFDMPIVLSICRGLGAEEVSRASHVTGDVEIS
jgi:hypothetical protein